MAWWEETTSYFKKSGLDDPNENVSRNFWKKMNDIFFQETVDMLYFCLGAFTYIYLFAVGFLYLSGVSSFDTVASKLIRALAEPYLGAVGIYTILKESRKRRYAITSRHWGEVFVFLWLGLLGLASILAMFSKFYTLTRTFELIITLTLSIFINYVGSAVHKP